MLTINPATFEALAFWLKLAAIFHCIACGAFIGTQLLAAYQARELGRNAQAGSFLVGAISAGIREFMTPKPAGNQVTDQAGKATSKAA